MKIDEMCKHMKKLVAYCNKNKVFFGGCGECGSAWLTCDICNESVDNAHEVFEAEE